VGVYSIASASGLAIAAAFFFAFAALIAFTCYGLLTRPSTRRAGGAAARKSPAMLAAASLGLIVFTAIFFATLSGFHALTVEAEAVRLDYAVPPRSVVLPRGDIRLVTAKPAYKSQWQLEITTSSGRYSSALGSADVVKQVAAALKPE